MREIPEWRPQPIGEAPRTTYLVFGDWQAATVAPFVVRLFTSPGFRHVFAIQPAAAGAVIVNPLGHGLFADWTDYDADACAVACVRAGFGVLEYEAALPCRWLNRGVLTCVSAVKAMIGMRAPWVVTPKQLFVESLRRGAKVVRDVEPVSFRPNRQTEGVPDAAI